MNEHFVSIKVDREERPDVDHIYMNAVQLLTGRGGWPMTVFLTPDGQPFYGGTYFPPEDRHGLPGFPRLLQAIAQAWRERPDDVAAGGARRARPACEQLEDHARRRRRCPAPMPCATRSPSWRGAYDADHGGFGTAPKFPNDARLRPLPARRRPQRRPRAPRDGAAHAAAHGARAASTTSSAAASIATRSTQRWLVPHFEKMLYDNALLVPLYLDAYQLTGDAVLRPHRARDARLRAARDARPRRRLLLDAGRRQRGRGGQVLRLGRARGARRSLGEDAGALACRYWDVTADGNFEHRNILHVTLDGRAAGAACSGATSPTSQQALDAARATLFAAREQRDEAGPRRARC